MGYRLQGGYGIWMRFGVDGCRGVLFGGVLGVCRVRMAL